MWKDDLKLMRVYKNTPQVPHLQQIQWAYPESGEIIRDCGEEIDGESEEVKRFSKGSYGTPRKIETKQH